MAGRGSVSLTAALTVALGVALGVALAAGPAGAGGAVFLFDHDYYVPGDEAAGETKVAFGHGDSADLDEGPFFAWLVPAKPDIDHPSVLLGPIEFEQTEGNLAMARISFTVPNVRPGVYQILPCNEDCSEHWIGDLVGGRFTLVATREEIPLRRLEDRLTDRIRRLQGRLGLFRDRLADVETQANNAASDSQLAVESGRDLDTRVRTLQAELARVREDSRSTPLPKLTGWFAAGVLAGVGVVLLVARRRRLPELRTVPDSGPPLPNDIRWRPEDEPELVGAGRRGRSLL